MRHLSSLTRKQFQFIVLTTQTESTSPVMWREDKRSLSLSRLLSLLPPLPLPSLPSSYALPHLCTSCFRKLWSHCWSSEVDIHVHRTTLDPLEPRQRSSCFRAFAAVMDHAWGEEDKTERGWEGKGGSDTTIGGWLIERGCSYCKMRKYRVPTLGRP